MPHHDAFDNNKVPWVLTSVPNFGLRKKREIFSLFGPILGHNLVIRVLSFIGGYVVCTSIALIYIFTLWAKLRSLKSSFFCWFCFSIFFIILLRSSYFSNFYSSLYVIPSNWLGSRSHSLAFNFARHCTQAFIVGQFCAHFKWYINLLRQQTGNFFIFASVSQNF